MARKIKPEIIVELYLAARAYFVWNEAEYHKNVDVSLRLQNALEAYVRGDNQNPLVVHHINGNIYDNRPENLRLVRLKDHK